MISPFSGVASLNTVFSERSKPRFLLLPSYIGLIPAAVCSFRILSNSSGEQSHQYALPDSIIFSAAFVYISFLSDWFIGFWSGDSPIDDKLSRISFSYSLVERSLSVSSILMRNNPSFCFA